MDLGHMVPTTGWSNLQSSTTHTKEKRKTAAASGRDLLKIRLTGAHVEERVRCSSGGTVGWKDLSSLASLRHIFQPRQHR